LHGSPAYFFLACAKAEPAADFEAALVLPSRSTAEAAVAALADVTFGGDTWESELPAAVRDALPVDVLVRTLEDLLATLELVTFVAILSLRKMLDMRTVAAHSVHCKLQQGDSDWLTAHGCDFCEA
jgi:hypothetical protein